jgi:hypothetical protein
MALSETPTLNDALAVARRLAPQERARLIARLADELAELPQAGHKPSERFWASFGAWQDAAPVEDTLQGIHEDRRSKTEPPAL